MRATKIKMKLGCMYSNSVLEIDEIYISGCSNPGWFKKSIIYDYLVKYPNSIQVNKYPYPNLIPAKSYNGEKYVKSNPNNSEMDNLLNLPRE